MKVGKLPAQCIPNTFPSSQTTQLNAITDISMLMELVVHRGVGQPHGVGKRINVVFW